MEWYLIHRKICRSIYRDTSLAKKLFFLEQHLHYNIINYLQEF